MDAFEGILQDPLTRNKYLYAHADPVNNRDPSGYLTLGGMVSGIGNIALRIARPIVSFLRVGRVNGIRVEAPLRARVWLKQSVPRVQTRLPPGWGRGNISRNAGGWRWSSGKGNHLRVQRGNSSSPHPAQRHDYVKLTVNGRVIGTNGRPLPSGNAAEAHIPLRDWLTWASWKSPL